jgi:hypothetical protein
MCSVETEGFEKSDYFSRVVRSRFNRLEFRGGAVCTSLRFIPDMSIYFTLLLDLPLFANPRHQRTYGSERKDLESLRAVPKLRM